MFIGTLETHQAEAVDRLRTMPRALLADVVGLGKTVTALAHICDLYERGELGRPGRPIWWVTSANLIQQAVNEMSKFTPSLAVIDQNHTLFSPNKPKLMDEFRSAFPRGPEVVVVSFEHVHQHSLTLLKRFGKPAMFVVDEAMAVKNFQGKRHKELASLTRRPPGSASARVLAMTATPYENNPLETYALMRIIDAPGLWSRADFDRFVEYSEEYDIPGTNQRVEAQPIGWIPEHVAEFREFFERYTIRRTAEDAQLSLPVHVGDRHRFVPLTVRQAARYKAFENVKGAAGHTLRTLAGRSAGEESALVDAFMDWLENESNGERAVVYCESLGVVKLLGEALDALGIGYRSIEGQVATKYRNRYVAEFNDASSDVRIFIGSKVLEVGLNLHHTCRNLISLDASDNPQREAQREGRIRRIGSPFATYRHLTFLPDTPVARTKVDSLAAKSRNADLLLGAPAPTY